MEEELGVEGDIIKRSANNEETASLFENLSLNGDTKIVTDLYNAICNCDKICILDIVKDSSSLSFLVESYNLVLLNNISLPEKMHFMIQSIIVNQTFYSKILPADVTLESIKQRIDIIQENICKITASVDDSSFLHIAKFIAKDINLLKRQIKSTLEWIPWEEMEFCLLSFVSSQSNYRDINLYYLSVLNKKKVIDFLRNFEKPIRELINSIEKQGIDSISNLDRPCKIVARSETVKAIKSRYPLLSDLCDDYRKVRDIHSLDKMKFYIDEAVEVNCETRLGKLVVKRTLQVVGELLKDSVTSPFLSKNISDLLLSSTLPETKKILTALRNTLSHASAADNVKPKFFLNIQNDLKKVGLLIAEILYHEKLKSTTNLLKQIIDCESTEEANDFLNTFQHLSLSSIMELPHKDLITKEQGKVKRLIQEVRQTIGKTNAIENEIIDEITHVIEDPYAEFSNVLEAPIGFELIYMMCNRPSHGKREFDEVLVSKNICKIILDKLSLSLHISDAKNSEKLLKLLRKFSEAIQPRVKQDSIVVNKIEKLIGEVYRILYFHSKNVMWLSEYENQISTKRKKKKPMEHVNTSSDLNTKRLELQNVLKEHDLVSFLKDKKLRIMLEMLLLDIMSDVDDLPGSVLFLDNQVPLLVAKNLRNYLAHGNNLVDVLLPDIFFAILANANMLKVELICPNYCPATVPPISKPNLGLSIINSHVEMIAVLEQGNIEALKKFVSKGYDLRFRDVNLWTSLHYAAKGPSLEVVKYLAEEVKIDPQSLNIVEQSALHIAAIHGRTKTVWYLFDELDLNPELTDVYSLTPLHLAAMKGFAETSRVLLAAGAEHSAQDGLGETALHYAISNRYMDVVKVILEEFSDVDNIEDPYDETPLHIAARYGYIDLAEYLIEQGANVNAKNCRGWRPLHFASLNAFPQMISLLIKNGAHVNLKTFLSNSTALHIAVESGCEESVLILLNNRAYVNVPDYIQRTPLHRSAAKGVKKIIQHLIHYGANISCITSSAETPIFLAAKNGHTDIVQLLIDNITDVNFLNHEKILALRVSAMNGFVDIVEYLVTKVNDIDSGDTLYLRTALHLAALQNNVQIVEALLRNGANVNVLDKFDLTPLHLSARAGFEIIAETLLENNINPKFELNTLTPLHLACLHGKSDVIKLFLNEKYSMCINAQDDKGYSPLHNAARNGYADIVKFLLDKKAKINALSNANETPLHLAVMRHHLKTVEILLNYNANVNMLDDNDFSPLCYAARSNKTDILRELTTKKVNRIEFDVNIGNPLLVAIKTNNIGTSKLLLNTANINTAIKDENGNSLLHIAVDNGNWIICKHLLAKQAADGNWNDENAIALSIAVLKGNKECFDELLETKIDVNYNVETKTPCSILQKAVLGGNVDIVKTLLIENADHGTKIGLSPIEISIQCRNQDIFELLFCSLNVNYSILLDFAIRCGNLDAVKFLVQNNVSVCSPIHIAAATGNKHIIEYFLSRNVNINDVDSLGRTALFNACTNGKMIKYLIQKGANVNANDESKRQTIHFACETSDFESGSIAVSELLDHGSMFDQKCSLNKTPIMCATSEKIVNQLNLVDQLFEAVKCNDQLTNDSIIHSLINKGASINACDTNLMTLLHYATLNGNEEVCTLLLNNNANPNVRENTTNTPLHFSVSRSSLKMTKALLSNNAVYNVVNSDQKTPLDLARSDDIRQLLQLIDNCFDKVRTGNSQVVDDIRAILDKNILKAVFGAHNTYNKSIVVVAMESKFPATEALTQIFQGDKLQKSLALIKQKKYTEAIEDLTELVRERTDIFGKDNPGTLEIFVLMAKVNIKTFKLKAAWDLLSNVIFHKRYITSGQNYNFILTSKYYIGSILFEQNKINEAYNILTDVYEFRGLASDHINKFKTGLLVYKAMKCLKMFDESLIFISRQCEECDEILGANHKMTLKSKLAKAFSLNDFLKRHSALKIVEEILPIMISVFGLNHKQTLRCRFCKAKVFINMFKYEKAIEILKRVLFVQGSTFGENDSDTKDTRIEMKNVLYSQYEENQVIRFYFKEPTDASKSRLGDKAVSVLFEEPPSIESLENEVISAVSSEDFQRVLDSLQNGNNVNALDDSGRTPLFIAVEKNRLDLVELLLLHGADATAIRNDGFTCLHEATIANSPKIAETLLKYVKKTNNYGFVKFRDAQTYLDELTSHQMAIRMGFDKMIACLTIYEAI